jgi:hypothetical protein
MFKNYLRTALRNIFRHKLYSVINIGGLAIGLAYFIIAGLATLLMAWITVGGLVYRVAKNSPVHALRCE